MRITAAIAMSVAMIVAAPALAADSGDSAPPADTAKPTKAKKICRDLGTRTGTRMGGGKRCKTAEEWARIDGDSPHANADPSKLGSISRTNR